jgi:branched-chain amino acid transport system ATP-binding protein
MTVRENLEMDTYPYHAWTQKEETLEQVYRVFPILKEKERQLARTSGDGERQITGVRSRLNVEAVSN